MIRASGNAALSARTASASSAAAQHPALQLEIAEAIARLRRAGEIDHCGRASSPLVAQPQPVIVRHRSHRDRAGRSTGGRRCRTDSRASRPGRAGGLRRAGRRPQRRQCWPSRSSIAASIAVIAWIVVRRSKVCRPRPPASRPPNRRCTSAITPAWLPSRAPLTSGARILQRLADRLAARHFAKPGVAGLIGQHHHVAGEERRMRAARLSSIESCPATGTTRIGDHAGARLMRRRRAIRWRVSISAASSASSSGLSPVSGGRNGPAGRPTRSQPALTIDTA